MSELSKVILSIIAVIFCILAITWIAQGNDFFLYKVFGPAREQVRRQTFEETKSYNQGMVQELQNMQFEYIKADKEHKAALASVILHRAADYPEDRMPSDLRDFIRSLKYTPEISK
jgi:hypothetical protein